MCRLILFVSCALLAAPSHGFLNLRDLMEAPIKSAMEIVQLVNETSNFATTLTKDISGMVSNITKMSVAGGMSMGTMGVNEGIGIAAKTLDMVDGMLGKYVPGGTVQKATNATRKLLALASNVAHGTMDAVDKSVDQIVTTVDDNVAKGSDLAQKTVNDLTNRISGSLGSNVGAQVTTAAVAQEVPKRRSWLGRR